jgi:C_GCAxxG_C_C family probable redox protein
MSDLERMRKLRKQGFLCSQILMILALETQGKDNPDLIRAMNGLVGGIGFTGGVCGALTGGACLLGLYAGKAAAGDEENIRLTFMVQDLVKWFDQEHASKYGGNRCDQLTGDDARRQAALCPVLVSTTWQKVKDLLVENGFELSGVES